MKVAVIGATGYGGAELVRFLQNHPYITLHSVHATSLHGKRLADVYRHMDKIVDHRLSEAHLEKLAQAVDIVFLATPSKVAAKLVPILLEQSVKVIDLSGDFRIKNQTTYEKWYNLEAAPTSLRELAIYGLAEWVDEQITDTHLIANPGCFPTAILLGLAPLVKQKMIDESSIIIDAKTGASGAGKGLSQANHFSDTNENIKPYRINNHQHTPEIEQQLKEWNPKIKPITFTPHLVPMTRGIMATMYATVKRTTTTEQLIDLYQETYKDNFFIRIKSKGKFPHTKEVYGSNFCDIGVTFDERTNRITVVSVIDNLVKGASGQAIQNMNKILGLQEQTGLEMMPVYP